MREFFLAFMLLSFARVGFAGESLVHGKIPEWAGRQGIAHFVEDEFTLRPVESGKFEVDEQGHFEVLVVAGDIRTLILRCGYVNLRFFVKPGVSYKITLDEESRPMRSLIPTVYTYPVFETLDNDDPNSRIGWFNEKYEAFFAENAWIIAQSEYSPGTGFRRSKSGDLKEFGLTEIQDTSLFRREKAFGELALEFTKFIDETSASWNDAFCRTYCLSVCGELLLSAGLKPRYVLGEVLTGCQPLFLNPAYAQFVSRSFNSPEGLPLADTLCKVSDWINKGGSASDLVGKIGECCGNIDQTMLGHVLFFHVMALRERLGMSLAYLRELAGILDEVSGEEALLPLLNRSEEDKTKLERGRVYPDILLLKADQSKKQLSEYRDQMVCLAFFATWNAQSLEELAFMDGIAKKYRRELKVVAISLDERFEDFRSFVAGHHKYQMEFFFGFAGTYIREQTGVWSVPHFLIISPEGRILRGQAKLPSRGLEAEILKEIGSKPEERVKVWDD